MPYLVYVSGPLTTGNPMVNVQNALNAGRVLMARGYTPFVPHIMHFWEALYAPGFTYDDWMAYDLKWLERCELMLRLPGESWGADIEETRAGELLIPVFYSIDQLMRAYS